MPTARPAAPDCAATDRATIDRVSTPSRLDERIVAAFASATLGLVLLWVVGFAAPDLLHAAAHDTRHAAVFPCH